MRMVADNVALGIQAIGVVTIVVGVLGTTSLYLWRCYRARSAQNQFEGFRSSLGKAILLGLGLLVAIRTFLSFSLEVEINGQWPWRRAGNRDI